MYVYQIYITFDTQGTEFQVCMLLTVECKLLMAQYTQWTPIWFCLYCICLGMFVDAHGPHIQCAWSAVLGCKKTAISVCHVDTRSIIWAASILT